MHNDTVHNLYESLNSPTTPLQLPSVPYTTASSPQATEAQSGHHSHTSHIYNATRGARWRLHLSNLWHDTPPHGDELLINKEINQLQQVVSRLSARSPAGVAAVRRQQSISPAAEDVRQYSRFRRPRHCTLYLSTSILRQVVNDVSRLFLRCDY